VLFITMALFQPLQVGVVTYYEQRATAGLIIAEATMVAENQSAFCAAWKKVIDESSVAVQTKAQTMHKDC
jgi:2,4-dienoyl-CoA reductase-like NADH-dependent reductase (Old Yellow Enzyme family)